MPDPDITVATPGRTGPPWNAEGTVYFYGGWLSNFAPTPGLRLRSDYLGHHENDRVPVASVEHWFQACKATSRRQFDVILACGSAQAAKRAGRQTELRPDWEQVKLEVMLCVLCPPWALLSSTLSCRRRPRLHSSLPTGRVSRRVRLPVRTSGYGPRHVGGSHVEAVRGSPGRAGH